MTLHYDRTMGGLVVGTLLLVGCQGSFRTLPVGDADGGGPDAARFRDGGVIFLPDSGFVAPDGGVEPDGGAKIDPFCGDSQIDVGERCDDGNSVSGDGCTANCDAIEQNYACPTPGALCVSTVVCGDGKVTGSETCDDRNDDADDGCDTECQVEDGWRCPVVGAACQAAACGDGVIAGQEQCEDDDDPPTAGDGCDANCQLEPGGWICLVAGLACERTVCGNGGGPEGSEQCDDGNNDMGDGCTPFCMLEPDCSGVSWCVSACGDGIKLPGDNEDCDDGNTVDGDGCSHTCEVESGYQCTDVSGGDVSALELPIVLRDFAATHPDMENGTGSEKGIVTVDLGADGKPVYAKGDGSTSPTTHGETAFNQWYRDTDGVNLTLLQTMTLTKEPTGEFRFHDLTFWPIDGEGLGNSGQDAGDNWHNFHFTSEVRYWFEYEGGEQLSFTGDDDVWVFINKQRVIDLGGVHGAEDDTVILDAPTATSLGLEAGKVYEIVVFQAERHTVASNYELTLSNFNRVRSACDSVCGNGIRTPDEACDDGTDDNDGLYGHCNPDCSWGPHCGDAEVQGGEGEACDDGVNLTPYDPDPFGGCAPGCLWAAYCGDSQVNSLFGEQCDDGINDGGYGECAAGCVLGPHCGDKIVQSARGEACDDGNRVNGDGCSSACQYEGPG